MITEWTVQMMDIDSPFAKLTGCKQSQLIYHMNVWIHLKPSTFSVDLL